MYSLASCYFGIILHVHASAEPEIHFLGGGGMWYEGYLCLLGEVGVGWGWKAFYYMNYNKYSMGGGVSAFFVHDNAFIYVRYITDLSIVSASPTRIFRKLPKKIL